MTKPQEAFNSMIAKVLLFLKEFIKIWEDNKAIEGAVTVIRADANAIDTNWEVQRFVTKGVGKSKKETRDKLDNETNIMFSFIRSYAISVKDTVLYEKYNQTFTDISQYKDTLMGALAKMTAKEIDELKDKLTPFGLTADMAKAYEELKDKYLEILAAPDEAKSKQRTATLNIKNLISGLRTKMDKELDNYMIPYSATHKEFYINYLFARIIYDNPTRHYSLMLAVLDEETGLPVKKAKVTPRFVPDEDVKLKSKYTTKLGNIVMQGMEEGQWELTIENPKYDTLIEDIQIVKDELLKLSVKIRKKEEEENND